MRKSHAVIEPARPRMLPGGLSPGQCWRLVAMISLLTLFGCSTPTTVLHPAWQADDQGQRPLGRVLVLGRYANADIAAAIETEWVEQLNHRGIDATAAHALLNAKGKPHPLAVLMHKAPARFDTILITRLIAAKAVHRDAPDYQVTQTETLLYNAQNSQVLWSARADTYLIRSMDGTRHHMRPQLLSAFVASHLAAMPQTP